MPLLRPAVTVIHNVPVLVMVPVLRMPVFPSPLSLIVRVPELSIVPEFSIPVLAGPPLLRILNVPELSMVPPTLKMPVSPLTSGTSRVIPDGIMRVSPEFIVRAEVIVQVSTFQTPGPGNDSQSV